MYIQETVLSYMKRFITFYIFPEIFLFFLHNDDDYTITAVVLLPMCINLSDVWLFLFVTHCALCSPTLKQKQ